MARTEEEALQMAKEKFPDKEVGAAYFSMSMNVAYICVCVYLRVCVCTGEYVCMCVCEGTVCICIEEYACMCVYMCNKRLYRWPSKRSDKEIGSPSSSMNLHVRIYVYVCIYMYNMHIFTIL